MAAPRRHRYRPAARRQTLRFAGKLIGCTDTVFAMGVDAATVGALFITEAQVRAMSDEASPDPSSPGLNLGQLDKIAGKLRVEFTPRRGDPWSELVTELDRNAAVVAQLWYADIGGTPIGHAIYLQRVASGRAYGVDPMKGVYGSWAVNDVLRGMRHFADRAGLSTGLLWGAFRPAPWLARDQSPQAQP